MSDLVIREAPSTPTPRVKPQPKAGSPGIPVPFDYKPSDDGTDDNILILLHGLGQYAGRFRPNDNGSRVSIQVIPISLSQS